MSGLEIITRLYFSQREFFDEWYPHYSEEIKDEMSVKMTRGILNILPNKWIEETIKNNYEC